MKVACWLARGCLAAAAVVMLPAPARAVSDLVFDKCVPFPANPTTADPIRAMFYLKNVGLTPAVIPTGMTAFKVWPPGGGSVSEAVNAFTVQPGASKGWTYIGLKPAGQPPGPYDFRVDVDPNNSISEQNETNNSGVCRITVSGPPAPADLTAMNCTITPSATRAPNDRFDLGFSLRNQGTASALLPNPVWQVAFTKQGASPVVFTQQPSAGQALAAGASQQQTKSFVPQTSGLSAGTYNVTVTVDPQGLLSESNRSNNTLTCPALTVLPPGPDLVYDRCVPSPANPTTADPIRAMFYLKNVGLAPAVIPTGMTAFKVWPPGGGSVSEAVNAFTVQPGASKGWTYIGLKPAGQPPGPYDFRVDVDPNNSISEQNETNNSGVCRITVVPGVPACTAKTLPLTSLSRENRPALQAALYNRYNADGTTLAEGGYPYPQQFWGCASGQPVHAVKWIGSYEVLDPNRLGAGGPKGLLRVDRNGAFTGFAALQAATNAAGASWEDITISSQGLTLTSPLAWPGQIENRVYSGGTVTIRYQNAPILTAALSTTAIRIDTGVATNCNDDATTGETAPVTLVRDPSLGPVGSSVAAKLADALLADVGTSKVAIQFLTRDPTVQVTRIVGTGAMVGYAGFTISFSQAVLKTVCP